MRNIHNLLAKLNITPKYKGYSLIINAVEIILKYTEKDIPFYITKDVYDVLVEEFDYPLNSVQSAIKRCVELGWEMEGNTVQKLLGYKAEKCPTNKEFLFACAQYLMMKNE